MGIPGWALAAGAAIEAPRVANNYMDLFKNVQELRDQNNSAEELKKIQQFKTPEEAYKYKPADGYISPASLQTLEKLRADKLDSLLRSGSSADLAKVRDLQMDPNFQDPASVAEINKNPTQAVFGQATPTLSGFVPAGAKGELTASGGGNPYTAAGLAEFQSGLQDKLARFKASSGDRWAASGITGKAAEEFKNVAIGQKDYQKMEQDSAEQVAEQKLNTLRATYDLKRTLESRNGFVKAASLIENIKPELVQKVIKELDDSNAAPTGEVLRQFVTNGPNSTRSEVALDWRGVPVTGTRIASTNNPSDRELGLVPAAGSGDAAMLDVAWNGPDGIPQAARVARSELSNLKASLKAQGIKEISTVDGKRASRTETLIKPEKAAKRSFGPPAGGAPAPADSKGGYTYKDGKLVAN